MERNTATRIAIAVSIAFGLLIALLAVLDIAVGTVAAVGGVLLGAMWVVIAVFLRPRGGAG